MKCSAELKWVFNVIFTHSPLTHSFMSLIYCLTLQKLQSFKKIIKKLIRTRIFQISLYIYKFWLHPSRAQSIVLFVLCEADLRHEWCTFSRQTFIGFTENRWQLHDKCTECCLYGFFVVLYCCVLYRGSNAGLKVFNNNNKEILIFLSESARGSTDFNNIFRRLQYKQIKE